MNFIDAQGNPDSRELGTFMTKREAMDRVEQEFEQAPGPPCKVLMKDGHKVIETSVARAELPAAVQAGPRDCQLQSRWSVVSPWAKAVARS